MRNGLTRSLSVLILSFTILSNYVFADDSQPVTAESALNSISSDYLSDVFAAVSNDISFEPYVGMQRGAAGTALAGSGNALDKSLVLVYALKDQVAEWRLQQGKLNDSDVANLLSNFSTELNSEAFDNLSDAERYDVLADSDLHLMVRDHYWVEVKRQAEDDWLALDPSMPGAGIGDVYAKGVRPFTSVPEKLQQRLTMHYFVQTRGGKKTRVAQLKGSVADLSRHPISLVVRAVPQFESDQVKKAEEVTTVSANDGSLLSGGGLFGGSEPKKTKEIERDNPTQAVPLTNATVTSSDIVATEYRRELHANGQAIKKIESNRVSLADESTELEREWLEITLKIPGVKSRKIVRDLFNATDAEHQPAAIRRYSLSVVTGYVSSGVFDGYRQELTLPDPAKSRSQLSALQSSKKNNETALKLIQLEAAYALTPHLLNLAFVKESDAMSQRLAQSAGVQLVYEAPRIIISSIETDVSNDNNNLSQTTLDLRLDEVKAIPYGGMPKSSARLFQRTRGMQESALEGRVLAQFVEDPKTVLTTTEVLRMAQEQSIQMLVLAPNNRSALDQLKDPSPQLLSRLTATLDQDHQVIIPMSAPETEHGKRWGWWDVDPTTGAFVGVMESGQHQAMTQYTVTLEKIGVNDAMGFVIGALVGSTATMTLYSDRMLVYGKVSEQLIQEVAAGIERLTCVTCPSFEVIVSPIAASASIEATCFGEHGVSLGTGAGVSGSISFCEQYKAGISCAASLMLGTYSVSGDSSLGSIVNTNLGPLSCE